MTQNAPSPYYASINTSLGLIFVVTVEERISDILFADNDEAALEAWRRNRTRPSSTANAIKANTDHPLLNHCLSLLKDYLDSPSAANYRELQALPLILAGTAFQQKVWKALMKIPFGRTMSYTEIAHQIGAPKSTRAVANACAANRHGIIVPCHRVLRRDGGISGYRWGIARKQQLIAMEADPTDR